jgi:amidophosphoribosyltransferase
VTLETCALPNLGYEVDRELGPAEIVRITPDGVEQLSPPGEKMQICAFLWVYYGYPASNYEGINVEGARNRCGAALARADDVEVDCVAGIPDSGVGHAIGYASEAGVPYRRPFVKYTPTWPRSFMPQDQRVRDLVARMKLIPIREQIDGKRLLFCEDSIVRGTQLKDVIQRIFDLGATEVHMRIISPPVGWPCFYGIDTDTQEQLIASSHSVEEIAEYIGADSLAYLSQEAMVRGTGRDASEFCMACFDGDYPVDIPDSVRKGKLSFEPCG